VHIIVVIGTLNQIIMEIIERRYLRSSTQVRKQNKALSCRINLSSIKRFSPIKELESTPRHKIIPVYTPGPKPSNLLLRYIADEAPPKLSRVAIIRSQLHQHNYSLSIKRVIRKPSNV
jgi:hypothetical protein